MNKRPSMDRTCRDGSQEGGAGDGLPPDRHPQQRGKGTLLDKVLYRGAERMIRVACEELFPRYGAHIFEWLAGPISILPPAKARLVVTGLGPSAEELLRNASLAHRVVSGWDPAQFLPLRSRSLDGALLLFGVERVPRPSQAFKEVARVLKPGGLFLVVFSSVTEGPCVHPGWTLMEEQERLSLVVSFFDGSGAFGPPTAYGTKKRYRSDASKIRFPVKDRPSVWIVYARTMQDERAVSARGGEEEGQRVKEADPLLCPYCGVRLKKYAVPHSPFEIDYWYDSDYLYICFNDRCPYFERGWTFMWSKLRRRVSCRHMYNPATDRAGPVPVPTYYALKDGIVEEPESASPKQAREKVET